MFFTYSQAYLLFINNQAELDDVKHQQDSELDLNE